VNADKDDSFVAHMKFQDFKYTRPQMDDLKGSFQDSLAKLEQASTLEAANKAITEINAIRSEFSTMYNICSIRHSIDTKDEFYDSENSFFDKKVPEFREVENEYFKVLVKSKFRPQLEAQYGKQLFVIADLTLKTFKPEILDDLIKENGLQTEYTKLKAGAKLEFEGESYNLSSIAIKEIDEDQNVRKGASEAKWKFMEDNSNDFERIYGSLVNLRDGMSKKLGYSNYIELGYARMLRSDYNEEDVSRFRNAVLKHIVPLASELKKRQEKRIGVEKMYYYDEPFKFGTGNPKPAGDPEWIIEQAKTMYTDLSPETSKFMEFMLDKNLMDLTSKDGKAPGGYCTYIPNHESPYIFSNFNGTRHDIDVLTHEAGHAFQVYESRIHKIKEYWWPTYEACEIHSMSMEFFTWPWMNLFFKEDTEKYFFSHMADSLTFLPYGVLVDEFQHVVYKNPGMTPEERNGAWRELEKKYLPHRDYGENTFLENGGYWEIQSHIFSSPFYYIDYTLAQICAFQFWIRARENREDAWKDYLDLCRLGGSFSFLDLVKKANLKSPFEENVIKETVDYIQKWLADVDDSKF